MPTKIKYTKTYFVGYYLPPPSHKKMAAEMLNKLTLNTKLQHSAL